MTYDVGNIFAKILRAEIPSKKVLEDDWGLAFHDIAPKAPLHVLMIPKGPYTDSQDFYQNATPDEITGFGRFVAKVIEALDVKADGYRLLSNCGLNGGQEVPHYHIHLFAGKPLGPMLATSKTASGAL